jgi:hypothetical protein
LVIVGEEVGVAGVWLTGVEYLEPESTRHKVIDVELKGVDAVERSRRGVRSSALSQKVSML